jgi:hypothetical protein
VKYVTSAYTLGEEKKKNNFKNKGEELAFYICEEVART